MLWGTTKDERHAFPFWEHEKEMQAAAQRFLKIQGGARKNPDMMRSSRSILPIRMEWIPATQRSIPHKK